VPRLELRFTQAADSDYNEIDFHSALNWGTDHGVGFTDELLAIIDNLRDFPESGSAHPEFGRGVRLVPFKGLLILYRPYDTVVRILRIVSDRQDLESLIIPVDEP
jgi:plasmid stabilization system protein ParE